MKTLLLGFFLFLGGCQKAQDPSLTDLKNDFINTIFEREVEEGPFSFHSDMRAVFFSKELISLFGETNVQTSFHGSTRYEGRTFCKIDGRFREVTLADLFRSQEQMEFLRDYCERSLKSGGMSYFTDPDTWKTRLELQDLGTFVIDEKCLRLIFQNYTVGGLVDGPFTVAVPYHELQDRWNNSNPLSISLQRVLSSKEDYISCWDMDQYDHDLGNDLP